MSYSVVRRDVFGHYVVSDGSIIRPRPHISPDPFATGDRVRCYAHRRLSVHLREVSESGRIKTLGRQAHWMNTSVTITAHRHMFEAWTAKLSRSTS